MSNAFFEGAIEDVDFDDISEPIVKEVVNKVKSEIGDITPDDSKSLSIDLRQIEKILNITKDSQLQIARKNIALPIELYEDIKLLAKYEEINSSKLILNAIKNYVANRQFILDKINEVKTAHNI